MRETALECRCRAAWLSEMTGLRHAWSERSVMDAAYALEALGVSPDGVAPGLGLAEEIRSGYVPAGLTDVAKGYRIGVTVALGRCSASPSGPTEAL